MACGIWFLNASKTARVPPSRHGVGSSWIGLPTGPWPTVLSFLTERFPAITAEVWCQRMQQGDVVDEFGIVVTPNSGYPGHGRVYYYRDVPDEPRIALEEIILFQDEQLVVVDKPHFLPVVPSGGYLQETVLVRLKQRLGIDTLVPIHRIDRDTAGVVLFCVQAPSRARYNALFSERRVQKIYEAIAPWRVDLALPLTRSSRIVPANHFMLQHEIEGPPNAITHVDLLEVQGTQARYALKPVTGKRHQLRVHMAALGMPIVGDGLYPTLTPEGQVAYENPLRLLAKSIEFIDPVSKQRRYFESTRRLDFQSAP